MAENDAQRSDEGGVRVPQELREVWAAKSDVVISPDDKCIDFCGRKYGCEPTHLTLTELEKVTDTFVVSLLHHKLSSINVALCKNLTDESIKAIAKVCPGLKELNLCGLESLTDESIKAIAEGCPELKEFNVSSCHSLTDESIKAITRGCPKLRELNASGTEKLTDMSVEAIANSCPELKELKASRCYKLTDKSIKAIAKGCPELKTLDVYNVIKLTDVSITAIAIGCPGLRVLKISSDYITGESIKAIAEGCTELKELKVYCPISDESIKAIAQGCPGLTRLDVFNITTLTDESIKGIANGCPELKELNVSECTNLTDESLKRIATDCSELTELNISMCNNLTDELIKAIAKGCPKLKRLNVAGMKNLTDGAINAIAKGCPELQELDVSYCHRIRDSSIKAIAKGCPELEELSVSSCDITDESIKVIAEGCPELKKLAVSHCRIRGSFMRAILEGCPRFEALNANHCYISSIPDDIGHRLPRLQHLDISANKLTVLPPSILKLRHLQYLDLEDNPLQSPPYEIAIEGLDAIKVYFEELEKGSGVSKLLKVVLVGDSEAGKTSLRNALAGRPNPRQEDPTVHLDTEKITLSVDLDINVYDFGGKDEYLATTLPYLTGLALYIVVLDAHYATHEYADALEDKLYRFLVVMQNRVPGAVVLPIVTKADTVEDPERRRAWLESNIEQWLQGTRTSMCGNRPHSSFDIPHALMASVAEVEAMRNTGDNDEHHFIQLRVQSPALAVSVADTGDVECVRDSVKDLRNCIIALTKQNPPLLRGVGQQIPSTYVPILKLFGAIAEYGDNDLALEALRDGHAHALGETSELSPAGTYRPKDELEKMWKIYCDDPNLHVEGDIFDDATRLWEAQGLILVDAGLVVLQPEKFITTLVKPLVDHPHDDEKECEHFENLAAQFLESTSPLNNDCYNELIDALYNFRATAEFEASNESLFLSFLWRDTGLDKSHYGHVLQMLANSGVILGVAQDASKMCTIAVVPFRLPQNPDENKLEEFWPKSLTSKERELKIRFESKAGWPTGLTQRFVIGVHGCGTSLYSWRHGVVFKDSAGYSVLAERRETALHFSVRFEPHSTEGADAAWKALCDAQQVLKAKCKNRIPRLLYKERFICEECCRKRSRHVATEKFDAKRRKSVFRACGHPFDLEREMP